MLITTTVIIIILIIILIIKQPLGYSLQFEILFTDKLSNNLLAY